MTKVKVSEATGPVLDWMVAVCEGEQPTYTRHWVTPSHPEDPRRVCVPMDSWLQPYEPSTNWAQGGPIIEWRKIGLSQITEKNGSIVWVASAFNTRRWGYGPTPLTAAMRCYVVSRLGDEVEVPEELLT